MMLNFHTHHSILPDFEVYNLIPGEERKKFFSCGIHPWDISADSRNQISAIEAMLDHPGCVAIGECGLDTLKGPNLETQIELFKAQAALAEKHTLPLIIHCVRAWNELQHLKRTLKPEVPWIWHGFNRPKLINEVLKEGLIIGLGFELIKNKQLQNVIETSPISSILLETDDRKADIKEIYECLAAVKKLPLHDVEDAINNNVKRILPKWTIGLNELSS